MTDNITIRHRYTDAVLLEYQPTAEQQANGLAMRAALEAAAAIGAELYGAKLYGAKLRGADMRGAKLYGADLGGADLRGSDLRGADLGGSDLLGANLRGADMRGSDLDGADLRWAELYGAKLYGAKLYGANLDGANLDDKKLIGKRPILMIGPIGSRADYFTTYMTDAGVYLLAGCFFGSADEFSKALEAEHGENEHGQEYRAALALIECHARLWAPEAKAVQPVEEAA